MDDTHYSCIIYWIAPDDHLCTNFSSYSPSLEGSIACSFAFDCLITNNRGSQAAAKNFLHVEAADKRSLVSRRDKMMCKWDEGSVMKGDSKCPLWRVNVLASCFYDELCMTCAKA